MITTIDTPIQDTAYTMDTYIGSRLRERRLDLGISQDTLAEALGITFQQIQKYEKGTNLLSAARLWECARLLDVNVLYFYKNMERTLEHAQNPLKTPLLMGFSDSASDFDNGDFVETSDDIIELVQNFAKIKDPIIKKTVLDLVKSIGDTEAKNAKALQETPPKKEKKSRKKLPEQPIF